MITIHTKPNCIACVSAKKFFTKKGVPFTEVALTEESTAEFVRQGFAAAPIVECKTPAGTLRAAGGSLHIWKQMAASVAGE